MPSNDGKGRKERIKRIVIVVGAVDLLKSIKMRRMKGKKAKIDPWKNRDIFCEKVERRKQDAENS